MTLTPTTLYRLHTVSTKHDEVILEETSECFSSFTCYASSDFTQAHVNGLPPEQNDGLIIEIISQPSSTPLIKSLAESIQHLTKHPVVVTVQQLEILQ